MKSGTALFLLGAFLLPALLQAAEAQPETAEEAAKSLELQEARTLYTRDLEKVSKVDAGTWLIERKRKTRDDEKCKENWVTVKYTRGLARTVQASGDPEFLYFCDIDTEADTTIARPSYNFRALLGGTATVVEDGSALFREVEDKHHPLLKSLRRNLESGQVQPQVQVTVAGDTLKSDTLTAAEGGVRIPIGIELEQAAEERRATFNWSGTGVIEDHRDDYAQIPRWPEATLQMEPEPGGESSEGTFPWWALALVGILATLAGALGLFLYWKREDLYRERKKKEQLKNRLKEKNRRIKEYKEKKKKRDKNLRKLYHLIQNIYGSGDEETRRSMPEDDPLPLKSNVERSEETNLLREIEERLQDVISERDLKKELLNQVQKPQEWKEELRELLHEQLPETADHRTSPEEIESLREEVESLREVLLETVNQRGSSQNVEGQNIEELSRRIGEALFSRLEESAASGEEPTEDRYLRLPVDELEARVPSSPLLLKPGEDEAGGVGDRDRQNDSQGSTASSLQRSVDVDRLERLTHPKKNVGAAEQEEQEAAPGPDTQTEAGASVAEERIPEEEEEESEQERPPGEVDPEFMSIHNRCEELAMEYAANNSKKHDLFLRIRKSLKDMEKENRKSILNEKNAAKNIAKIFMEVWDPEHPDESLEVLEEVTSETESSWDFYYPPGGRPDTIEEIRERRISEIATEKIDNKMKNENIPDGETSVITPGIDWKGRREGRELSFSPIQYRPDYSDFEQSEL